MRQPLPICALVPACSLAAPIEAADGRQAAIGTCEGTRPAMTAPMPLGEMGA